MCAEHSQSQALFPLGNLYMTPGAKQALEAAGQSPFEFTSRSQSGDFGDVPPEDAKENEFAIENDLRILSSYTTTQGERIWCLTEATREATTLLLPSEY